MLDDKKKKEVENLPDKLQEAETICTRKELEALENNVHDRTKALTDRVSLSEVVELILAVEELERRQIAAMLRGYASAKVHERVAVRILLNASVVEKNPKKK